MEKKFTPGPWRLQKQFPHQQFIEVEHSNANKPGAASIVVARVTCRQSWKDEQQANARLIAAAPELLEALQELCDIVQGVIDDGLAPAWLIDGFTLQPSRAAIKKALGEKQ